jgi:hypothetical protein
MFLHSISGLKTTTKLSIFELIITQISVGKIYDRTLFQKVFYVIWKQLNKGHVTLMDDKKKLCTEYNTRE